MNEIQLSAVFLNYNTKELTVQAINSIFEKTEGVNFEIIVVDNASSDGSVEYLKNKFGDKITVIASQENLGCAGGNNLGIKAAKSKYVFLLNTDIILINNAFKILYDAMEKDPDIGAAGPNLYTIDNKPNGSYSMKLPDKNYRLFKILISRLLYAVLPKFLSRRLENDFNYSGKIKEVEYIVGACILLKKSVLDKVGLLDTDFFVFMEDIDIARRIKLAGFKICNIPSAKVIHYWTGQIKTILDADKREQALIKRFRYYEYSYFLYICKVYGKESSSDYYKKRLLFMSIFETISFGKYKKKIKFRKQIINEEYENFLRKISENK